jgi:DNA-binding IclR family transcriptional regulator
MVTLLLASRTAIRQNYRHQKNIVKYKFLLSMYNDLEEDVLPENSDRSEPRRRQVPAVTRAIAIMRCLSKTREPIGVNQLARELGLVPSTCMHILRVLVDEGFVTLDAKTKRYSIGVGILPIARRAMELNSFAKLTEASLTELSNKFGATAVATQLTDNEEMVVVALSRAQQPFRLQVDLGSRFPALISATGRCYAAYNLGHLSASKLTAKFRSLKWDNPPSYPAWKGEVDNVPKNGFAIDQGNYISGVTIVAVPLLDGGGRMTHSIVAIDITERFEAAGPAAIAARMLEIRNDVTGLLFGE